ncbi:MAG: hypothetical protein ABSG41_04425 [Bryobacteraceae bacterium]|jgi:cytochrome c-type biogenesis protein CcmH/NrfF
MVFARALIVIVLAASPGSICAGQTKPLSTAQARRVDMLYGSVIAHCCIRKPAALKIREEIRRRVTDGQSDQMILAVFAQRFGGQPLLLDNPRLAAMDWIIFPVLGFVLWAGWASTSWTRQKP